MFLKFLSENKPNIHNNVIGSILSFQSGLNEVTFLAF